jgi:hypothetical protein
MFMTTTQDLRRQDAMMNSIIEAARRYRGLNGFEFDHPVVLDIPDGLDFQIKEHDRAQLEFLNITVKGK